MELMDNYRIKIDWHQNEPIRVEIKLENGKVYYFIGRLK